MAINIEHRDKDTLFQAFDYFDMPNFAIYAGKDQRTFYNGGDQAEAEQKLSDYLSMIEAANTSQVYTLKVYPADTKNINTKTPHSGSTTFMLNPNQPVRQENGVTIIDRTAPGSMGNTAVNPLISARLDKLEAENLKLREDLHKAEIQSIKDNVAAQIAGIAQRPDETPWYERLIGAIEQKPELIDKLLDPVERLITGVVTSFQGKKNFIQKEFLPPVNGTNPDTTMADTNHQQQLTEEEVEKLHDQQDAALEIIEARIGAPVLTKLIEQVSKLSDKDLNKLLNYLD